MFNEPLILSLCGVVRGRPPFAFLRWFQLFCLFRLVSAVCLPD